MHSLFREGRDGGTEQETSRLRQSTLYAAGAEKWRIGSQGPATSLPHQWWRLNLLPRVAVTFMTCAEEAHLS